MRMCRRHNPGMQHLACAVYIMINALYPLSHYIRFDLKTCPVQPCMACLHHLSTTLCTYKVLIHCYLKMLYQ